VEVKCQPWRHKDDQPCPSEREGFGKENIKERKKREKKKKKEGMNGRSRIADPVDGS
jgi:hypothetical protein